MTGSDFEFPRMALAPGLRVGAYEVQEQIGHGGMGDVYRARDTNLNREVALKVISMRFMDDPDRISRFRREARILAALNHPNIGGIYGVEEIAGQTVLVLELVDGISLATRIARGALPVADAVVVAKQIAEALEAAHESGIVHRDLKPDNVKLRTDGTLKVLDFGVATTLKPVADIQSAVTTVTVDSPRITSTGLSLAQRRT
jgi:serine/threonine-protein kinase